MTNACDLELPNLCGPQFPHLEEWDYHTHLIGMYVIVGMTLNEMKCLGLVAHIHRITDVYPALTVNVLKLSLGFLQKYSWERPKHSSHRLFT